MFSIKIKKSCDRIGTKKGEVYMADKYKYDPYCKVFLPQLNCFEYVSNIEFISIKDKLEFYQK